TVPGRFLSDAGVTVGTAENALRFRLLPRTITYAASAAREPPPSNSTPAVIGQNPLTPALHASPDAASLAATFTWSGPRRSLILRRTESVPPAPTVRFTAKMRIRSSEPKICHE